MNNYSETLKNGLSCGIDWLSWTLTDVPALRNALKLFGFRLEDFFQSPKGASGYKQMLLLHDSTLRVLYDGNKDMGIHFDVSGSAIADLFAYYKKSREEETPFETMAIDMDIQLMSELLNTILKYGHVTRLDLAIDNQQTIYYRLEEVTAILNAQRFVSRFRSWREVVDKKMTGEKTGHTLYLGSRTSDIMLRIYDKRAEQNATLAVSGEPLIDYEWVRWELELKDDRAEQAVRHLVDGKSVGAVCVGILNNYFRVVNLDSTRKERCSTDIKWERFVDGIDGLRLYVPHEERTLVQKQRWIEKQVLPTLTGLLIANYGDASMVLDNVELNAGRMTRQLRAMVEKERPGWERELFLRE